MLAAQNMLAHGASGLVLGPVLAPRTLVRVHPLAMVERDSEVGLFAFYSSVAGAITTAPELMTLPIDDHAIVRGHAVFDTCTLACGRLYRLTIHLHRFLQSARAARIPLPYGDDDEANVRQMTNLIRQTCAASGKHDADVRFWL